MTRVMHILALLALLLQCSPFRTCAFELAIFGSNCHADVADASHADDESAGSIGGGSIGGCPIPESPDHDADCVCERPKIPVERADVPQAAAGLSVPPARLAFDAARPFAWREAADVSPARPPPLARRTPLLI